MKAPKIIPNLVITFVMLSFFTTVNSLRCSEVEYCSSLRHRSPANSYIVDILSIQVNDIGIVRFNLQANKSGIEDLEVTLYAYKDDVLRVKIKEFNSSRYELSDILAEEPNLEGLQSVDTDASQIIITTNIGSRVEVMLSPFDLMFFKNNVLELVLKGDRLFIDDPTNSHAFTAGLVFPESAFLYGLSQHPTGLPLKYTDEGDPYRLFNKDTPSYPIGETDSVYGAVPVIYGHGPEFTAGIFMHNAAQQFVDILPNDGENMALFMAEAGTLDVFVFLGPTPAEVLRQYLVITGVPYMPPLWSLGFHQSRFSYMTQEEVKTVVANFDATDFQLDAIWLDLDYTDGRRYFTWNPENYTDPIEMQQNLTATNRKLIVISDPHIKAETGYSVYDGALENDLFVHNAEGSVYEGDCWPGKSSYIDFLNPEARAYYSSLFAYEKYEGTTSTLAGIWNDMNEPEVFGVSENVMPGDTLLYRNVALKELRNAYGMLQTKATHQGLLERDNRTLRPFVLSRSHFAGSQRYTAIWTGDNKSTWDYLDISYAMCLTANLVGIAFCGADVGGFNSDPDNELYQRWFQAGAWLPFFRVHSGDTSKRREPYVFPDDVQQVVRNAIRLRYKHLPVWYTLFHEHIRYKTPVIRPLFFEYTDETKVFDVHNQLLVGTDIMVRAVSEPGVDSVSVFFPGNECWLALNDYSVHEGRSEIDVPVDMSYIPVYYRCGSIIPRKDTVRPTTTEMFNDEYTLYVTPDANNTAHGTIYLDDTISFYYLNYVEYNYLSLDYHAGELTFSKIDTHSNSEQFDFAVDVVVTHEVVESPKNGEPGKYVQKRYNRDVEGNLLKDMRFNFRKAKKWSFKLE